MTTTTVHTIGSGGDYSTLQAWEDAAPANLVTSDVVWRGEMLNSISYSTAGTLLTIGGSTTDATRYKVLAAAAGLSFKDNASKLTNALRGNSANGITISGSANTYGNPVIVCSENFGRIEGLQVLSTATGNGGVISGLQCYDCIIEGSGVVSNLPIVRGCQNMINTLVVLRTSTASTGAICHITSNNAVALLNCTIVVPSDFTATTYAIAVSYSYAATFKNCAFFGATTLGNGTGGSTFTNCYTDAASPPSGCTTVAYDTSTGSGFENITDATRDFRIKSTSALKDTGTATGAPAADIVGTTRTAPIDVGAWEFTGGGGGGSSDVAANSARYGLNSRNAYGLRR